MTNKWGRPKKGEWKTIYKGFTLYQKDLDEIRELGKLWRLGQNTDVLRKAISLCLEEEGKRKV